MTSPITPEIALKIAQWRIRAVEGTLTLDEMKEAVVYLRQGRVAAASASASAKRKRAIVEIPHADDLLEEI